MKKITAYVTNDGQIWPDFDTAKSVAINKYAASIDKMAVKLVKIEKIVQMRDFLSGAVEDGSFQELLNLRGTAMYMMNNNAPHVHKHEHIKESKP